MKDGRIVAADLQYYSNAGNTIDESLQVCKSGFSCYSEGKIKKEGIIDFVLLADRRKDSAPHGQRLQHPQPAWSRCRLQDQPALQHFLQGLRRAAGHHDHGEHDQRRGRAAGTPCGRGPHDEYQNKRNSCFSTTKS